MTLFDVHELPITDERSYVLAATPWPSNAELVLDCARLGYLRPEWRTLDATYGRGVWWRLWRPRELVTNDVATPAMVRSDFRALPFAAGTFDAVAYDPPYIAQGGRDSSTEPEFMNRFGLHAAPRNAKELQMMMNGGLTECAHVLRRGGYLLVKCKNYVNGREMWAGTFRTWESGIRAHLRLVDVLEHLSGTGPQSQTRQVHARSNYSTLLVFKK